jgi:hypothetical protein
MALGGALVGGIVQGSAAKKAAKAQERAAQADIAFQKETRDIVRGDYAPYREGGVAAQNVLDYELGLRGKPMLGGSAPQVESFMEGGGAAMGGGAAPGGNYLARLGSGRDGGFASGGATRPGGQPGVQRFRVNGQTFPTREEAQAYANANKTGGTEYGGWQKDPTYQFRLDEGVNALESSAAARGGLYSGAAMRDALKYNQQFASNERGNYLSRLGARADAGMSAAGMSGQASQQAAAGVSNAYGNIGNAQAAGAIGFGNAINQGMQNALGAWNYQKNIPPKVA